MKLVETDNAPGGYQLVNPYRTNKVDKMDLVAMAQEIQKVKLCSNLFGASSDKMYVKTKQKITFLACKYCN